MFNRILLKLIWVIFQFYFYVFRFLFIRFMLVIFLEVINFIVQVLFDVMVYKYFGVKVIFYFIQGIFLGIGFYSLFGYFILEYYMFIKGQEIYFYYGFFNLLIFNVGYYNEYYDFFSIFGFRFFEVSYFFFCFRMLCCIIYLFFVYIVFLVICIVRNRQFISY